MAKIYQRRPGERRDPYRVIYRWSPVSDTFRNNYRRGFWVPAFAGTTRIDWSLLPPNAP
jgi:hypothetical protein